MTIWINLLPPQLAHQYCIACVECAQLVNADSATRGEVAHARSATQSSSSTSSTVVLSQDKYDRLCQLEFS